MDSKVFEKSAVLEVEAPLHRIECWFLYGFLILATSSWVGIGLAELHLFGKVFLLSFSTLLGLACMAIASRSMRAVRDPISPRFIDQQTIFVGGMLVLGTFLFFQPAEYLFDGFDASVYVNTARMIEKTGAIWISDPIVETLPNSLWDQLFPRRPDAAQQLERFPGAVEIAKGNAMLMPDFFHLFPVWVATFNLLFGPLGGFYVSPVFGLLSLLVLWLLGRRLFSPLAGALGAGLLLVNFGQLWYARFPASEVLTEFFLLAGLYLTVLCVDGGPPVVGFFAGAAFGLAAFCRIDVLFLISPLVLAFLGVVALERRFSKTWWWYLGGLTLLTLHAVGHAMTVAKAYTMRIVSEFGFISPGYITAMLLLIVTMGALYLALFAHIALWNNFKTHLYLIQFAALGILAVRMWPHLTSDYLGLLLSPVGVVAAFGGFALLLSRNASLRDVPVIFLFLGSALFYLESARATALLPWALRRYVPIILPLALLLTGHLVATMWGTRARLRPLVLLVPAFLGIAFLLKSWPILRDAPMRGAYAAVAQFAARFPPTALLLFDRSTVSHLPLAVDYTFGRQALDVFRLDHTPTALQELTRRVLAAGRPVYVVNGGVTLFWTDLKGFEVRPVETFPLRYVALKWTRNVIPQIVRPVEKRLEIYQVLPRRNPAAKVALPLVIDIGGPDFPYLVGGFHDHELWGTTTVRWTKGEAQLRLPRLGVHPGRRVTLVLRVAAPGFPGASPPLITLALNGSQVARFAVATHDFAVHRVPLSASALAKGGSEGAVLTLRTSTFIPADVRLSDDSRKLGVALDWVALKEEGSESQGE